MRLLCIFLLLIVSASVFAQTETREPVRPADVPVDHDPEERLRDILASRRATRNVSAQAAGTVETHTTTVGNPDLINELGNNTTAVFNVRNASQSVLFQVEGDGDVLVGTTSRGAKFSLYSEALGDLTEEVFKRTVVSSNSSLNDIAARHVMFETINSGVTNSGSIRGTYSQALVSGAGTITSVYGNFIDAGVNGTETTNVTNAYGLRTFVRKGNGSVTNGYGVFVQQVQGNTGYGLYVADLQANDAYSFYSAGANDNVYIAGKVGIGTNTPGYQFHVVGNSYFQGTVTGTSISATYQDVAEWVPSTTDLAPGTVVVLNPERTNEVMISGAEYDSRVAGVVSHQPGLILGESGSNKEQVATTGRVKVRVDASRGPIRVGDLLVTSNKPGMAMRSEPMSINGRSFHQPGTILGKALEPLEGGEGEILVLLSMQ